jgi:hypothetical protein
MTTLLTNSIWYEQEYEININKSYQTQIEKWLNNFSTKSEDSVTGLIISGGIGTGKNTIVKNAIKKVNWKFHMLYLENDKSWDFFSDFITGLNENMVLIINDANLISSPSEKRNILEFFTQNCAKKYLPIIFLTNLNHSKLITTLSTQDCDSIRISLPAENDLLAVSKIYIDKYNLKFDSMQTVKDILNYSQYDIRRLIILLQDLYYTYGNKITRTFLQNYLIISMKKNVEVGLFSANKSLMDRFKSIEESMRFYKSEKVLLPLMMYENFYTALEAKNMLNSRKKSKYAKISDILSQSDLVETRIYSEQNWEFQPIHGFLSCAYVSYILNEGENTEIKNYKINFSSDLNKTSLKNINKKNIEILLSSFQNRTQRDMHYISRLLNMSKASHTKLYSYSKTASVMPNPTLASIKSMVNSIIRIDKTNKNS